MNDEELARALQKEFDAEYEKEEDSLRFPSGIGEFVVKFLDDLWNNKNVAVVDEAFSEDCVSKGSWGETVGKENFKTKVVLPLFTAFPDLRYASHEVLQEGRRIVNRWTFTGTHTGGAYEGVEPHENKIIFSGVTINHFDENGDICEIHTFFDRLALKESLEKKN